MQELKAPYPQLTCLKPHHNSQPLIFVCSDYNCQNRIPICYYCKKQSHAGHKTEDLNYFFKKLNIEAASKDLKQIESMQAKLHRLRQYCIEMIHKERCHIDTIFTQLQVYVNKQCSAVIARIADEAVKIKQSIQDNARAGELQNYDQFSQAIERNVGNYHKNLLCEKELLEQAFFIARNMEECSMTIEKHLKQIVAQTEQFNDQLTKAFNSTCQFWFDRRFPAIDIHYRWSEKLKFKAIGIKGSHAHIGKDINILARGLLTPKFIKEQVGILMDNPLIDRRHCTYNWKVKVSKIQYTISLGMCLRSKVEANEYQRTKWSETNHGHYVISQQKKAFSHSDPEVNKKELSFGFAADEVITIQYDTVAKTLSFTKGRERFEMAVEPAPQGDCYHPCAYLTRTDNIFKNGESVEIVDAYTSTE